MAMLKWTTIMRAPLSIGSCAGSPRGTFRKGKKVNVPVCAVAF